MGITYWRTPWLANAVISSSEIPIHWRRMSRLRSPSSGAGSKLAKGCWPKAKGTPAKSLPAPKDNSSPETHSGWWRILKLHQCAARALPERRQHVKVFPPRYFAIGSSIAPNQHRFGRETGFVREGCIAWDPLPMTDCPKLRPTPATAGHLQP